jgi:hypothetical protein
MKHMSTSTNNKKVIVRVAEAGLLIALLVVVQLLTFVVPKSVPLVSQLFTGSLVNLVLIVGAATVGFSGTALAAILSPVLAFAFGQLLFPQMIPVVAIGNLVIVAVVWAFFRNDVKLSKTTRLGIDIAGIVVGAAAKTAFLWAATLWLIIPMFFSANATVSNKLSISFSWLQLITALIGGILAMLVLPALRKYRSHRV